MSVPQSREGEKRIKGSWKRGRKRPNSFLSVVCFNFPRFASEPFNSLQPAPLPTHFLVLFPISAAIKGPRFPYLWRNRPRIDTFDTSTDDDYVRELQKRSVRNTLITQRYINLCAVVSSNKKKMTSKIKVWTFIL